MSLPWLSPAAATGVGSLPGTDIREATNLVMGEVELAYLPELPARGPGADMVGRTMARLAHVDPAFSMTTTPSGWRLTDRPGRDVRRAMSWWGEDLDALEERAHDFAGTLKVSLCGPFTLAAAVELVSGEKIVRDTGARRDVAAALAEAVRHLVPEVQGRVPHAKLVVQFDEPSLSAVLAGSVSSASGLTSLAPVEVAEAELVLAELVRATQALGVPVAMHSCSAAIPFDLWNQVGVNAISFDAAFIGAQHFDAIGAAVDSDVAVLFGIVPAQGAPDADAATARLETVQRQLGFSDDEWLPAIGVSPACGLATLSGADARAVIDAVNQVSRSLRGARVGSNE